MPVSSLLEYDDVLRQQREIIYAQRNEVLESENLRSIVETMITSSVERNVVAHVARMILRKIGFSKLARLYQWKSSSEGDITARGFSWKRCR